MSVIAFVLGTFLIAWVCYMTWAKDFIDKYWAIFWISIGISFVGAAITGLTNVWYISLIFNMLTCKIFLI